MTGVYSVRGDEPIFVAERLSGILILRLIKDPAKSNYRSKQFEYNRMMRDLGDPEIVNLLLDFSDCVNVDSVTFGMLVSMTLHPGHAGRTTAVCGCREEVRRMLKTLMSLEPASRRVVWTHYPTRRHAIEALCSFIN